MTQKKNDNTTGTTGTQSGQGNVSKTGEGKDFNQPKSGQGGSQMGGKNPPAGGPETFESDQVNQGKQDRTTQGGAQSGRGDPYPPVNPDRPMMAGGQQGSQAQDLQSKQGNIGSQGAQNLQGGGYGGNVPGSSGIGGAQTGKPGQTGAGEEEE